MVWIICAILMIVFGAGFVAIGLLLPLLGWAIVGAIMFLAGIFWLVAIRRSTGPLTRNLRD